ncbi:geranylgeranyl pyrophosphate synthetase [Blastocladiella emersonii ATCC 22665]|nr:geranylgeranyl pyrophosphate synthetase [Blastocladiella emersonii ATCC 22665]
MPKTPRIPSYLPARHPPPPPPPSAASGADSPDAYCPPLPATDASQDEILLAPYQYLLSKPGKGVRSRIFAAFNHWLHVPPEKLEIISNVVEMLHGGSLLIDDIEDGSSLRRGRPVAHRVFGVASTINCANYVYFLALRQVQKLKHDSGEPGRAVELFTEELVNAHEGQGIEIFWRENAICPTEQEYLTMVGNKTSALLRLGVGLMVEYRGNPSPSSPTSTDPAAFSTLATSLGNLFQIRDDYINLVSADFAVTKGYCEDIEEGKFSYPMIHAIRATPHDRKLLNILKQRPTDRALKEYALELLRETGSLEFTRRALCEMDSEVSGQVKRLGGNPMIEAILGFLRKEYADATKE